MGCIHTLSLIKLHHDNKTHGATSNMPSYICVGRNFNYFRQGNIFWFWVFVNPFVSKSARITYTVCMSVSKHGTFSLSTLSYIVPWDSFSVYL